LNVTLSVNQPELAFKQHVPEVEQVAGQKGFLNKHNEKPLLPKRSIKKGD
jgi:hypothetical protein